MNGGSVSARGSGIERQQGGVSWVNALPRAWSALELVHYEDTTGIGSRRAKTA